MGLFGFIVAAAEIAHRYPDAPTKAIFSPPGLLYIVVNMGATVAALAAMKAFDLRLGVEDDDARWARVVIAGFGAVAFFRSSFFLGRRDTGQGPVRVLRGILGATDRAIDRHRAEERARAVRPIMAGLTFDQVRDALPSYCLSVMQNVSDEEARELGQQVRAIEMASMTDAAKVETLALTLIQLVGEPVLRTAVKNIRAGLEEAGEGATL